MNNNNPDFDIPIGDDGNQIPTDQISNNLKFFVEKKISVPCPVECSNADDYTLFLDVAKIDKTFKECIRQNKQAELTAFVMNYFADKDLSVLKAEIRKVVDQIDFSELWDDLGLDPDFESEQESEEDTTDAEESDAEDIDDNPAYLEFPRVDARTAYLVLGALSTLTAALMLPLLF